MKVNPITQKDTSFKVPKVKGKDNNMNRSFEKNFNTSVRKENMKMNCSGRRR